MLGFGGCAVFSQRIAETRGAELVALLPPLDHAGATHACAPFLAAFEENLRALTKTPRVIRSVG
jgi:hypothetical protein